MPDDDPGSALEALGGRFDRGDSAFRRQNTQITDAGLKHLARLASLKNLGLSRTRITGAGMEHLRGIPHLISLDLNWTQVTDDGLEHVKGLTSLNSLWLYNTQITDAGRKELKAALPRCHISSDGHNGP